MTQKLLIQDENVAVAVGIHMLVCSVSIYYHSCNKGTVKVVVHENNCAVCI